MASVDDLRQKWTAAGQGHCLDFLDELPAEQRAALLKQLESIDPRAASATFARGTSQPPAAAAGAVSPLPDVARLADASRAERDTWRATGLAAARDGEVGLLLLAGGQGTRLGSSAPKGMYDIGLPSGKSLFRLQGEKIRALERVAGANAGAVPWYVMTSDATDAATRAYFAAERYFGLREDQVIFFEQAVAPAFLDGGAVALESKGRVAVAPNGNGGVYGALESSGALADMRRRGVKHVYQYCVDNALVKVGDPEFVGLCALRGADCASKVVPKSHAHEKVGVLALRGGQPQVVEYSEIDAATAERVDGDGRLVFSASHICVNYFSASFLERCASELAERMPLHVARKKIPHVDGAGVSVSPTAPNGVKLELFIFDTFPFAQTFSALEGARADDFAPVKNAPGPGSTDSPDTARALVAARDRARLEAAGCVVVGDGLVEIDAALSYDGEGLEGFAGELVEAGRVVTGVPEPFSALWLVAAAGVVAAFLITA